MNESWRRNFTALSFLDATVRIGDREGDLVIDTGVNRKMDALGRIVIPNELCTTMGLEPGSRLEILHDELGQIILRQFRFRCEFCNRDENLLELFGKKVCRSCAEELRVMSQ